MWNTLDVYVRKASDHDLPERRAAAKDGEWHGTNIAINVQKDPCNV